MELKQVRLLMGILIFALVTLGCAALSRPVEDPAVANGEAIIATAIADTLSAYQTRTEEATLAPTPELAAMTPIQPTETQASLPDVSSETPGENSLVVAYVDALRNIWVWRSGETPIQITSFGDVESVKISGDGAWIAFTRTSDYVHYELWGIRSDGSGAGLVMGQPDFAAIPRAPEAVAVLPASFGWKPGDQNIVAFTTRPTFEGPGLMMNDDLWLAGVAGGERNEVLPAGDGGQFHFSPDGAQIALVQPDSISLVNSDGSGYRGRVFVYSPVITYSEFAYYVSPVWAPDSSYLLVVIPPRAALDNPDDPAVVWRIPLDGSPAEALGSFPSALGLAPVLAPNLEKLVYFRQVGGVTENRYELHIANPDGTEDEFYQEGTNPTLHGWAPGGKRFLFSIGEGMQPVLGETGAPAQPLNDISGLRQVTWVDEERFLYVAGSGNRVELRLRAISGEETVLTSYEWETSPVVQYDFGRLR